MFVVHWNPFLEDRTEICFVHGLTQPSLSENDSYQWKLLRLYLSMRITPSVTKWNNWHLRTVAEDCLHNVLGQPELHNQCSWSDNKDVYVGADCYHERAIQVTNATYTYLVLTSWLWISSQLFCINKVENGFILKTFSLLFHKFSGRYLPKCVFQMKKVSVLILSTYITDYQILLRVLV